MADKYNLDYFDDDRVAAKRSQYRREYRQPMNRPPQNGRGPVPNNRNNVHRKPPKRKRFSRRLRNRIIIVSVGILILILIITMISSMFRACTGSDKKVDNNSDKTIPPTQAATTQPATQAANAAALNFVTPNIQDDNTTGYMGTNAYIWNGAAYELFGGDEYRAQLYADSINSYQQKLSGIKVYNMVVPNHTEMGLPQRLKNSSAPSDSQAENIKQIYSKLNSSVTPINAYNKIAEHCNEYVYYNSDHHWTGLGAYYAYTAWAQAKGVDAHALEEYEQVTFPGFTGSYYTETQAAAMEANPDTVIAYKPLTCDRMTFTDTDGNTLNWPIINDVSGYRSTQKYSCFAAGDQPFSYIENPNVTNGQACILVKESYADAFVPYLTDHYQFIYWFDYREYNGNITEYIRTVTQTEGINTVDIMFLNGLDPISSIESMNRLNSLMQ